MSETDSERVERARLELRRLDEKGSQSSAGPWAPAWSSSVLDQTVSTILSQPESRVRDVLEALWILAGEPGARLTAAKANFIRDLVVLCFTRYKDRYEKESFNWMERALQAGSTESQAYLAALALPETLVDAYREPILKALGSSDFLSEVEKML